MLPPVDISLCGETKPEQRIGRGAAIIMEREVHTPELSPEELRVLQQIYHRTPDSAVRTRCHIVLLSAHHYSVPQIAQLLFSSEETVVYCIDDFNRSGLDAILTLTRFRRGAFGRDYSFEGEG